MHFKQTIILISIYLGAMPCGWCQASDSLFGGNDLGPEPSETTGPSVSAHNKMEAKKWNMFGVECMQKQDGKSAAECFRRAMKAWPSHPTIHNNLGNAYWMLRDLDAAESEFRQAVKLDPKSASNWSDLGGLLEELKKYGESIDAYSHAIALEPTGPLYYSRAVAKFNSGDRDGAVQDAKEAARLSPAFQQDAAALCSTPAGRKLEPSFGLKVDSPDLSGLVGFYFGLTSVGSVLISSVLPGSPAAAAGIQPGDQLVAIDGTSVNGLSKHDISQLIPGTPGTNVTLSVIRNGKTIMITCTRRKAK